METHISDDPIIQKQDLLRKEIIEKDFDKQMFLDYCMDRKENGDDLDNWTLDELANVINEFKQMALKGKDSKLSSKKDEKLKKEKEEIQVEVEKIKIYKTGNEEKYLEKEINCRKIEKTVLNGIEVAIIIKDPKTHEGGFFSSNYVSYEIFTEVTKWSVRRRYSDFEWIRNMLIKYFPGHLIPPLPSKKVGARRFDQDFILKRMVFLQKFLNVICESEYFKSCEALIAFLSYSDRTFFENRMKEYNNHQSPLYVEDVKTFDGKVQIVDDEENEKYFNNITNYFSVQTQLLERINYSFKCYHSNILNAALNLEDIEKDFQTIFNLNCRVLMVSFIFNILKEEVTKTYDELHVFFKNWKRILHNQNEIFKHNIKDFFKYINMENYSYKELIKAREDIKVKYNSELLKLNVKKEKLWTQMDTSKWELSEEEKIDKAMLVRDKNYAFKKMCYKESTALNNLHKRLGYVNKMNMDELRRLINNHCGRYTKNMKEFVEVFYPTLTDVKLILKLRVLMFGLI